MLCLLANKDLSPNIAQKHMDNNFKSVDYLDKEKVFVCTFKDKKKFFLNRENISDNVNAMIDRIILDDMGEHFTIKYVSGKKSVIPWDFVRSICDAKYEYYKQPICKK